MVCITTQYQIIMATLHNKQWFIDRISTRIFRNPLHGNGHCKCKQCEHVTKVGLIIKDKFHAEYLYTIQYDLEIEYNDKNPRS